jgi:hypothetical protein
MHVIRNFLVAPALLLVAAGSCAYAQSVEPAPSSTKQPPSESQVDRSATRDAVDRIRDISIARRDEALAQARKSSEAIDRDIARLQDDVRDRWGTLGEDAKTRMRSALADLRERRTRAAEWNGGMQHASDRAWEEVKIGFVDSYHTLSDSFGKARAQFDASSRQAPPKSAEGNLKR